MAFRKMKSPLEDCRAKGLMPIVRIQQTLDSEVQ